MKRCIKKILAITLALGCISSSSLISFAAEKDVAVPEVQSNYSEEAREALLPDNLIKECRKLNNVNNATIQIADGIYLIKKTETPNMLAVQPRMSYTQTSVATFTAVNAFGASLVEMKVSGTFTWNNSTVKCTDSTGVISADFIGYETSTISEGHSTGNVSQAYAKAKFSFKYYFGLDPLHILLHSYEATCYLYCDAYGNVSSDVVS